MEMAEWIFDFFNNASFESPVNEDNLGHAEVRNVEKNLSSAKKEELAKLIKSGKIKTSKDLKNWLSSKKESVDENALDEETSSKAFVPSNIKEFAKRKGVTKLVNTVAGWAEEVDKKIVGGVAVGRDYDTLVLDMTYQGGEIRIDCEYKTVELYDEPVRSLKAFKKVFNDYNKKEDEQLTEAKYSEYAKLIDLVNKADNPRNLPIYYNSDFGVVNIGGVGYDKGELVNMFNSQPGTSVDIKNTFFRANQNPEQTAKDVNSLNMGVKAEVDYGYGKEPFIKFTKGYSDDFLDQEMKTQMSNDEETLRRERGLEEIKQRVFNKLKK